MQKARFLAFAAAIFLGVGALSFAPARLSAQAGQGAHGRRGSEAGRAC